MIEPHNLYKNPFPHKRLLATSYHETQLMFDEICLSKQPKLTDKELELVAEGFEEIGRSEE